MRLELEIDPVAAVVDVEGRHAGSARLEKEPQYVEEDPHQQTRNISKRKGGRRWGKYW